MWIAAMPRAKGVSLSSMAALYLCIIQGAAGATFDVVNNCTFTVWAAASPSGGKRLGSGQSWTLQVPAGTSSTMGRFWGRTGCSFNSSGRGSCSTGDCGGLLNCQGSGTFATLATLVEYTLNGYNNNDFYDISLVDGFNLPMSIIPSNSSCAAVACSRNITAVCPAKLKVTDGCKSACAAFNAPQYCCTGDYSNNCSATNYSKIFKGQCPQAYSYALDDSSSTFTCPGGTDYTIVFCGSTTATASPATKNLTAPPGNSTVSSRNLTAPSGSTNLTVPSTNLTAPPGNLTRSSGKTSSKILPVLLGSAGGIVLIVVLCLVLGRRRHWKNCFRTDANLAARGDFGQVLFDYKVLRDSTANFDRNNMLGKGGFGEVYKGRLPDGRVVAVKKLNGKQTSQAAEEFLTEVKLITSVRHRNLVRLLGCCTRGHKRLLVYEFMPNNSLDKHLFGEIRNALNWENRLNIIVGTARGLAYLHGDSNVRIIHRDIKCANILLDDRFHPKIADFGLAKFFPEGQTHVSTRVGGTIGYTAPEYAVHGQLTEKADVYSYGIVVLEIVSGRKCVDARLPAPLQLLLEWAWNLFQQNQVLDIVDSSLNRQYPRKQVLRVINVALLCTQGSWALRPAMSEVVSMLTNSSEIIAEPTRPAFIDAPAERPANITPIPDSGTSAAAPSQRSHGSISVSLLHR